MSRMDTTRNLSAGADATQAIPPSGVDPARTVIGAPAFDPGRTAMGAPGGLTLHLVPGNRYAMATESGREHALVQLQSSGMMAGRTTGAAPARARGHSRSPSHSGCPAPGAA